MHSWVTITQLSTVGTRSYALKQEILCLTVPNHKKMEINSGAQMSCTPMKCGVPTISEECIQCGKRELLLKIKSMTNNMLIQSTQIEL